MSKARLVITAVVLEGRSQAQVARDYNVSKGWVSRLVARYREVGESAFEPRSRRPHNSPRATPVATVALILELRHTLASRGAPDDCSVDGLGAVFDLYQQLRSDGGNTGLDILGVVLTLTVSTATNVKRTVRNTLRSLLGEQTRVFESTIRFAQAAAVDCRRDGRLAHEYEQAAINAEPWWKSTAKGESFSRAATGLADDYQQLTNEVLAALAATRTTRRTA